MMSLLYDADRAWVLVDLGLNRWVLMLAINAFLLLAGCFRRRKDHRDGDPILTPVLEASG